MEHETAGDPITGLKWTRKTLKKVAHELKSLGIHVGKTTIGRLLKAMRFSLRVNHKKLSNRSKKGKDRNAQFEYIKRLRVLCVNNGDPIVSVDTKKRELIGRFKNPGQAWKQIAELVNDHDFPSLAIGLAILYGIYDVQHNDGMVNVGISHDTPEFAVDSIELWWRLVGRQRYPKAKHLYILADGGGSNGSVVKVWKYKLQLFAKRHGLTISVSHYPPGTSKWNPIEHLMFSQISNNWAGTPLETYETLLNYIRTTTTETGLKIKAYLNQKSYDTGKTIDDDQIADLFIQHHDTFPKWNYTLYPL